MTDTVPQTARALLAARRDDDRPAVVFAGSAWSGEELIAHAAGSAAWLDERGAPPGELVLTLVHATADSLALAVGGLLWDRPMAPLGLRAGLDELRHCVQQTGAPTIVAQRPALDRAHEVARSTGATVLELPTIAPARRIIAPCSSPGDVALLLHTSGTTGLPKPVVVRQDRLAARAAVAREALGVGPGSLHVSAAGFQHISGLAMMLAVVAAGGAVVPFPAFGVDAWQALQPVRPTHALMVPSHLEMLLDARALHLDSLERLHYGASPIHPDTLRAVLDALPRTQVEQLYGQTEGSPLTVLTHADHLRGAGAEPELLLSVGRAAPGVRLSIDDPDGSGVGELVARGPHLFATDAEGALATGDLAQIDKRGYVFLAGRRGDRIIRGGENVYPVEVERALESHPAVSEAGVFPIPDRRLGERLAVVVVPVDPDAPPTVDELASWCRAHLSAFKVPEEWRFASELPRNATGKLVRRRLRLGGDAD